MAFFQGLVYISHWDTATGTTLNICTNPSDLTGCTTVDGGGAFLGPNGITFFP